MDESQSRSTLHLAPGRRRDLFSRMFTLKTNKIHDGFCIFTFLATGNAAVALPKHAAESTDALGIPPTVVTLPSLRNTQPKVSITGETTPTGPVMFTHSLRGKTWNIKKTNAKQERLWWADQLVWLILSNFAISVLIINSFFAFFCKSSINVLPWLL